LIGLLKDERALLNQTTRLGKLGAKLYGKCDLVVFPLQCGGAVALSVCNICGAAIGGQDHHSTAGNRLETEYALP
jgi:hypothetical protein